MDVSANRSMSTATTPTNDDTVEKRVTMHNSVKRKRDSCPELENQTKVLKRAVNHNKYDESEYYFENGLRKVYPYYYTYSTFCKGRWVGQPVLKVFSQEFRAYSEEVYAKSIAVGSLKVNGQNVEVDYVLKDNDCITNSVHRHEIGVLAAPLKIIHNSDDLLVIDKPPSVPVHPCGRYRHNTVLFILAKEYDIKDLHTIHRLDRLTSGLLMFSRSIKKSQEIDEQIRSRKVSKEYVCRVEGLFPDNTITCNEPIAVLSPKMGISIVSPKGKECSTEFQRLSYNGKSSVVLCKPLTGRMHQIRVHLQYLGFPIVFDPIYNHDAFGPQKGKNGDFGKSPETLLSCLMSTHNAEKWLLSSPNKTKDHNGEKEDKNVENQKKSEGPNAMSSENQVSLKALSHYAVSEENKELIEKYKKVTEKIKYDENCDLCRDKYRDPEPRDFVMFLHAYRYKGVGWEFQTELPIWAREDWLYT